MWFISGGCLELATRDKQARHRKVERRRGF